MKRITGLFLMLVCACGVYSQATLNFCASVEPNGYCNFNNIKFITSPDSTNGRIFMQVKTVGGSPIGASNVIFKIYKLSGTGDEKFVTLMQQQIKPDWATAWMPGTFDSPGKYVVKVYNEADQVICSNKFEFILFK
jgi:hypothetical protein